ncbi:hypothetical protein C8A01DRAFT_34193 [Parachaetomium inaequale]|uniref:2EXR domain-containing protein n=1 Tax=Parachaetomium inaequale TaxID=2588326 RepID=A0AAN6PNM0_9PEZI|nr:hypothetical protein C8A01DRAFT_34193 [Parachaetomium inaequale]
MPRTPPIFLTLPLELRLEIYTHLLVLPPPPPRETLQTTYRCSYAASPSPSSSRTKTNSKPTLHPQILRVSTQTYHEALPILYSQSTFSAHPVHLTAQPTLYHPYCAPCRPVTTPLRINFIPDTAPRATTAALAATNPNIPLIKKWHLRIRLDPPSVPPSQTTSLPASPPPSSTPRDTSSSTHEHTTRTARITAAFTNATELTLDVWHATWSTHHPGSSSSSSSAGVVSIGGALRHFEGVRGVRRLNIVGMLAGLEEGYIPWLKGRMMMPFNEWGGQKDGDGNWQGEYTPVKQV